MRGDGMTQPKPSLPDPLVDALALVFGTVPLTDGATISFSRRGETLFLNTKYLVNEDTVNESITVDAPYDMASFVEKVGALSDRVVASDALRTAKIEAAKAAELAVQEVEIGQAESNIQ